MSWASFRRQSHTPPNRKRTISTHCLFFQLVSVQILSHWSYFNQHVWWALCFLLYSIVLLLDNSFIWRKNRDRQYAMQWVSNGVAQLAKEGIKCYVARVALSSVSTSCWESQFETKHCNLAFWQKIYRAGYNLFTWKWNIMPSLSTGCPKKCLIAGTTVHRLNDQ